MMFLVKSRRPAVYRGTARLELTGRAGAIEAGNPRLLMFFLKTRRPEKFRETVRIDVRREAERIAPRARGQCRRDDRRDRAHRGGGLPVTNPANLTAGQARTAIALGALTVRARGRRAALGPLGDGRHRLPDLTGQTVADIGAALLAAIVDAHPPAAADAGGSAAMCPACEALIELASRYGDPSHRRWPDPVRRFLAETLDGV